MSRDHVVCVGVRISTEVSTFELCSVFECLPPTPTPQHLHVVSCIEIIIIIIVIIIIIMGLNVPLIN